MLIACKAADVHDFEPPQPCVERLAGQRKGQRPRQHLRKDRQHRRPPAHASLPDGRTGGLGAAIVEQTRRGCHDQPAGVEVDDRNDRPGERDHRRRCAGALDFERVAGAEIVDRAHPTERHPVAQHRFEPDQVGVVIFLGLGWRQCRARQIEAQPANRLGAVAVVDARQTRDQHALGGAKQAQLQATAAALVGERPIGGNVFGARGEALDPHRAANPVRAGDDPDADLLWRPRWTGAVRPSRRLRRSLLRMRGVSGCHRWRPSC